MRLLVVTQVIDRTDPVLGFFHGWLEALAQKYQHIHVICLKEGSHDLPKNVSVHSLGKERGASRIAYLYRFFGFIWILRGDYDRVFVHMNQEYVLLAGWLWRLMRKPVYLWRNHYAGGFLTDIAAAFASKVFCTSKHSYTAKYRKTRILPVGIDTHVFKPGTPVPRSILSLGRIAPSKRIDMLIEALSILKDTSDFTADIYGDALPKDASYFDRLRASVTERNLSDRIRFFPGVPNRETPAIFSSHEIFVNPSTSGMFDKTIFEAAACGALSLASSPDYAEIADTRLTFTDTKSLANQCAKLLTLSPAESEELKTRSRELVARHTLSTLVDRLVSEMRVS